MGEEMGFEEIGALDGIVIDTVTPEDLPAIVRIDAAVTGDRKLDFWHSRYRRQSMDPKSTLLVARLNGHAIGYVMGTIHAWEFGSPPCGWVETISVDHDHRKRGIATHLFDAIISYFRSNGIFTIRTMLHIEDHALISFFRMQGMAAGPYIELEMQTD